MGQRLQIEWQESAAELKAKYQKEKHAQRRIRLLALWHLRQGKPIQEVVESIGTPYRVIQRWVAWYRQGDWRQSWSGCQDMGQGEAKPT